MTDNMTIEEAHKKNCKCLECRPVIPVLKMGTKEWKSHLKNNWPFLIVIEKVTCYVDRGQGVWTIREGDEKFSKSHGHLKQVTSMGLHWRDRGKEKKQRPGARKRTRI